MTPIPYRFQKANDFMFFLACRLALVIFESLLTSAFFKVLLIICCVGCTFSDTFTDNYFKSCAVVHLG